MPDAAPRENEPETAPPAGEVEPRRRNILFAVFKFVLAGGLLYGLWAYDRLPLGELGDWDRYSRPWLLGGTLLLFAPLAVVAFRWRLILSALGMRTTYRQAFSWTMIGVFFDTAMPGATGGDVVKAVYVARAFGKGRRSLAVLSVLLDRLFGLAALFFLSCFVSLAAWGVLSEYPRLNLLPWLLLPVCALWLGGFFFFTSRAMRKSRRRRKLFAALPGAPRWETVYDGCVRLRENGRLSAAVFGLCLLNHALICLAVVFLSYGMNRPLAWGPALVLVPLCLFLNSFGVFGGFGAGQAAFELLLPPVMLGAATGDGALLATVFHLAFILVKLFGLPFYLKSRLGGHSPAEPTTAPTADEATPTAVSETPTLDTGEKNA